MIFFLQAATIYNIFINVLPLFTASLQIPEYYFYFNISIPPLLAISVLAQGLCYEGMRSLFTIFYLARGKHLQFLCQSTPRIILGQLFIHFMAVV
jgi:hypothetical protein